MPQEHQVLKCFSCGTFQVHIVKKTRKWECKMCGVKQSLKRNYGKGNGKDCRNQVMKLNELRVLKGGSLKLMEEELPEEAVSDEVEEKRPVMGSKWTGFLEQNCANEGSESEDSDTVCLSEIVEKKKKRTKLMPKNSFKSKKICTDFVSKPSFDDLEEVNHFLAKVTENTFESSTKSQTGNQSKCVVEPDTNRDNYKKYPIETKSELKYSKYTKYLEDDEDDEDDKGNNDPTKVKKSSNIFGSDLVDFDNILNF